MTIESESPWYFLMLILLSQKFLAVCRGVRKLQLLDPPAFLTHDTADCSLW